MAGKAVLAVASLLLFAGCGGGGSAPPPPSASLSGSIVVVSSQSLRALDAEPNDTLAEVAPARMLSATGTVRLSGRVDPLADPVDAYRFVAEDARVVAAHLVRAAPGVSVVLSDLDTGEVAPALFVERGATFDVVVSASGEGGAYWVAVDSEGGAGGPHSAPAGYLHPSAPHRAGTLAVMLAPGASAAAVEAAEGLRCVQETPACTVFRTGAAAGGDDLRPLLCCAARLEAAGLARVAEPDWTRTLERTPDDPLYSTQWNLSQVHLPAAWDETTGDPSIVVGVVDSGIHADHPDLAGRVLQGYDFVDNDSDPTDTYGGISHGTAVAGVIAAATNNATGLAGVLWNGRILPVRVFNGDQSADTASIAQGIRYAAGLSSTAPSPPAQPARVINLSFSGSVASAVEQQACDDARAAGALLVAAAGNEGTSQMHYPAAYGSVIAVAATGRDGQPTPYSNYGSWITLAAPGGDGADGIPVLSADGGGKFGYTVLEGTSFSAPHVSAIAALVLAVQDYAPTDLESLLESTAQDVGTPGFDTATGYGIVNAYSAVLTAQSQPIPPLLPDETVEVRLLSWPDLSVLKTKTTSETQGLSWSFKGLSSGTYAVEAGTDRNHNGSISDAGEVYGVYKDSTGSEAIPLGAGEAISGLAISISPQ